MVIIFVRLAIGTLGWFGDDAATDTLGISTAALPTFGHGNFDRLEGIVVVVVGVVVVVDVGTVVVVGVGMVVVDVGMLVVEA